jgi:acyl-CoA thioesterase FadM
MRTIRDHPVRFGELAGPLVHGANFFDWQLVSTQELATAVDYPFEGLVADDAIPYAPVVVESTVHRYPAFGDTLSIEVTPTRVGDSSLELVYETVGADGEPFSTARMTHVTIAPGGGALPLPEAVRERLDGRRASRDVDPGPEPAPGSEAESDGSADADAAEGDGRPTFEAAFRVHAPHVEGSELAYFEEYPRFADVALESFLADAGIEPAAVAGDRQPFRLRAWHWEFGSTVPFGSTLSVTTDVRSATPEAVTVEHTFRADDKVCIEGITEYGCFDREGEPTTFPDRLLAPFEP